MVTHSEHGEIRGNASDLTVSAPDGWQHLLTEQGLDDLKQLSQAQSHGETPTQSSNRLRAEGLSPEIVAALLTQANLRRKAAAKFADAAERMLFTSAGLEQASRFQVAQLHAARMRAASCTTVIDLGCGIGSESLAFAQAGLNVTAVDIDEFTARIAAHNLRVATIDQTSVQVITADATKVSLGGFDAAFLDPARRSAGVRNTRRISDPNAYSPSLEFAFDVGRRMPTGIKLGPGLDRDLIPEDAEAQWISVDGELVEMGLWFGELARAGIRRSARVIRGGVQHELNAPSDAVDVEVGELGSYIYEPDGSVIRARLIGLLAQQLGGTMLSDSIAYLSSDRLTETPFAQVFRVREVLPASQKQLRRALDERNIGSLEIKQRGTGVDPAQLRAQLRLKGDRHATLILTRVAGKHTAILAERV